MVEDDRVGEPGQGEGAGPIGEAGRLVDDVEDALDGAGGLLHGVDRARQPSRRAVEHDDGGREGEEGAGRHGALDHAPAAVAQREHHAEGAGDLHQRLGDLVGPHVLERQPEQALVDGVEALLLVALASERLHDLRAGERLVEEDRELGHPLLGALVDLVQAPADDAHDERDEGKRDQRARREHPLAGEHHDQQRHDRAGLPDRHDEQPGGDPRQPAHVGEHARHEVGGVDAGEERQRHALDVDIEVAPQRGHDLLADRCHEIGLQVTGDALDDVGGEERQRDQLQHEQVALDEDVVHGRLHQPGDGAVHGRDQQGEQGADDQHRAVRPHVGQQPPIGTERHRAHRDSRSFTSVP